MFEDFKENKEPSNEPRADYIRRLISDVDVGTTTYAVEQLDKVCSVQAIVTYAGKEYRSTKWMIGPHVRKTAILQTLFHATAEVSTNFLRDKLFKYKGMPVFALGSNHRQLLEESTHEG